MTATEAAIRQATHENVFSCGVRPETVAEVISVLELVYDLNSAGLAFGNLDSFRELGALKWKAFAALTQLQADQKVFKEFGRVM